MASVPVYCICKQPYDISRFMIECDICKDWYHGSCVGIREDQSTDIEEYHCQTCAFSHGPLKLKRRRNWHRHDYTEDNTLNKAVQAGTLMFIRDLKRKTFHNSDEVVVKLHGSELTLDYMNKHGFSAPILVENKDGLGLIVPPSTFSVVDVERYVGSMKEMDVIDVPKQEEVKMVMRQWIEYYNNPNRDKVLNVISLEVSNTSLNHLLQAPNVVNEISWAETIWPDMLPEDCPFSKPQVSKYCLMGVKDSYTDFHADFGGTSVWYHVMRGEKVFYLIRPTPENLKIYEDWGQSPRQSEIFLADKVDACYKCVIKPGQTFFIPTGWIHAVLTTVDSLVFGGNFLHNYNVALQLEIYELERRLKTPPKFLFPAYEPCMWYAAKSILDVFKECNEEDRKPPWYLLDGARAMCAALRAWTHKREQRNKRLKEPGPDLKVHQQDIPETIRHAQLLKDLNKELRNLEKLPSIKKEKKSKDKSKEKSRDKTKSRDKSKEKKSKDKKSKKKHKGLENIHVTQHVAPLPDPLQLLHQLPIKEEKMPFMGATSPKMGHRLPQLISQLAAQQQIYQALPTEPKPSLKFKFPRADDTSTTTSESEDDRYTHRPTGVGGATGTGVSGTNTGFKLVVSNGKIISRGGSPVAVGSASSDGFQAFSSPSSSGTTRVRTITEGSEEINVVDDDQPVRSRNINHANTIAQQQQQQQQQTSQGSLKFKLSFNGKSSMLPGLTPQSSSSREASSRLHDTTSQSDTLDSDADDDDVMPSDRSPRSSPLSNVDALLQASQLDQSAPLPTISLADIEAELKQDALSLISPETRHQPASPGTQAAIQGMLAIAMPTTVQSKLQTTQHGSRTGSGGGTMLMAGAKRKGQKREYTDEDSDLPNCYQDAKYVYPSLDDDGDEPLFKSRSKHPRRDSRDAPWNPKAKVKAPIKKTDRPSRDGARRGFIEAGLEDAAARLANKPRPKRQYIRRKPLASKKSQAPPPEPPRQPPPDPYAFIDDEDLPSTSAINDPLSLSHGMLDFQTQMSSSSLDLTQSAPSSVFVTEVEASQTQDYDDSKDSPGRPKKQKKKKAKGQATAKQRLGRLLKLHKGGRLIV